MNKGFHIALVAALLPLLLLQVNSCEPAGYGSDTETEADSLDFAGGVVNIMARIEDTVVSKVDYPSSGPAVWNGGDLLSVFAEDQEAVFYKNLEFFSIQDGNEIEFTGRVPKGFRLTDKAVYPYSGRHLLGSLDGGDKLFAVSIASGLKQKGTGVGPIPMVGIRDEAGTYVFKHCVGALRVALSNMPSGDIIVTLKTKEPTVGRFPINLESFDLDYKAGMSTDNVYSVRVHSDDRGNAVAVFPLVPSKYSAVSITVSDPSKEEIMTKDFSETVVIEKGKFSDLAMELVIDTTADFSRWFDGTEYENYVEKVDLAQHGQLLNGCDTLLYKVSADTLYGYISVSVKTAAMKAQLRYLRVFIDHKDDQTTEFNPIYDIGWLDLPVTSGKKDGPHADLMFEGSIYQSGRIRKVQDNDITLYKISPGENPTESWGWAGGVTKGNGTHETIDHGFTGSGVFEESEDGGRFRYQFELARDVALITDSDLQNYSLEGVVTGKVNVMVVVSDESYGHSSICPDRGGTDLQLL